MRNRLSAIVMGLSAMTVLLMLMAPNAMAQGGSCRDPWINSAYNQLYHRAPQGYGDSGECNPALYGGGHWTSFPDLENKVRASKSSYTAPQACRDPWITSAYNQLYHRAPQGSGNSGECNPALYGGGRWSSFPDLENKIRASKGGYATPQGCRDSWITSAYNQLYHRAPQGSGNSGECNPALYGGGRWSSFPDLENKIRASKGGYATPQGCRDPWITSAYNQLYHRAPQGSGNSGECNPALYGGGRWSSFPDLENKIRASKSGPSGPVQLTVDSQGGLRNSQGQLIVPSGKFLISVKNGNNTQTIMPRPGQVIQIDPAVIAAGGGNVIAAGGGNVIAAGGGNVIAAGGGNVIAAGGGNMTGGYSVQSVGGKVVIPAISVH